MGDGAKRERQINLRLSDQELKYCSSAAEEAHQTLSEWARAVLMAAAGDRTLYEQLKRVAQSRRKKARGKK